MKHPKNSVLLATAIALAAPLSSLHANTLGYWRFEGDGVTVPTPGSQVEDTNGRVTISTGVGVRVADVSGNGNTVWAWEHAFAGFNYQADVPGAVIPQTGAPNTLSVQNAGSFPALMTWSKNSLPTLDVETIKPLAWTIEASIRPTTIDGAHRTFVGRDGNGVATGDGNLAPLYFQTAPGGFLRINMTDEAGSNYLVTDTTALTVNTWYNVAAVSDGSLLSLYKDSGSGYQLIGSTPLTSGDTRLAYDDAGSSTAGDTQWGWTIGRGRYGGADGQGDAHGDRWFGLIDEVRISDSALAPSQFLFSVPEPGVGLLALCGGAFLLRRRRASVG